MAILVTCQACKQTFRVRDEYLDKKAWCPACRAPITLTGERVSNHEVFISYSNKDKPVADAICAKLEALSLRCWIAPRDVAAGHSWGSSIIEAIEEAKVMVLVYSGNSNLSPQVIREVERAVSKGLVLVPFRIEAVMMSKDMEYFLSSSHWIDALTPPLEQHLVELGELVRTVLFRKEKEAAAATKPVPPAKPAPPTPTSPASQSKSRNKLWIAAAVALVAIVGMAGWWFGTNHQPTNQKAAAATSSATTKQPSLAMPTANNAGAAITISCSEEVRILPLEAGQPTFYDLPLQRMINRVSPELSGFQFVSVPNRKIISYNIRVNQDGVLYAFGFRDNKNATVQELLGTEEISKWENFDGSVHDFPLRGVPHNFCYRRKIVTGEIIKLKGLELQFAAKSIELVRDGKAEANTQPSAPVPTPAVVAPQSSGQVGQPWTNSLGMKFVPVAGTTVLFSIWDTRVQDYQAFVTATGRAWEKAKFDVAPSQPEFEQGPTHPAVNVSWDDAKAFCAWLTENERRAGMLNASQEYRLPTDLEWSTAVGLKKEIGDTPQQRQVNGKNSDVLYPWGTQWPPPRGAGNYGWTLGVDDFAKTSPVGSFAANQFGLYDMGGNVFQWCDDFWNGQSGKHAVRGSSWWHSGTEGQHFLLSSWRNKKDPGNSNVDAGFRCVLAKVGTGAANPATNSDK